jgi:hypothetical protein
MSSLRRLLVAAAAGLALVSTGLPAPAHAAEITDLDCESRISKFRCSADFEYSGLVTFKWYVNGRYQPLFPEWFINGTCPGGQYRTIKLVMIDDEGTDTRSRTIRCISGNP